MIYARSLNLPEAGPMTAEVSSFNRRYRMRSNSKGHLMMSRGPASVNRLIKRVKKIQIFEEFFGDFWYCSRFF